MKSTSDIVLKCPKSTRKITQSMKFFEDFGGVL